MPCYQVTKKGFEFIAHKSVRESYACQSMRKAFQDAEKVTKEEIDALLKEAEESLKKTE